MPVVGNVNDVSAADYIPPNVPVSKSAQSAGSGNWFTDNAPSKSTQKVSTKTPPKPQATAAAPQTISATKPSFLDRVTAPFTGEGTVYGTVKAQREGQKWAAGQDPFSKPLIDVNAVKAEDVTTNPAVRGAIRGAEQTATDFTTPRSVELMAATGGLLKAPVVGKLVAAGFGLDQIKNAIERAPEFKKNLASGDYEGATKVLTEMALGVEMGRRALNHAGSTSETASRPKTEPPSVKNPVRTPPPLPISTDKSAPPDEPHTSEPTSPLWDKAKNANSTKQQKAKAEASQQSAIKPVIDWYTKKGINPWVMTSDEFKKSGYGMDGPKAKIGNSYASQTYTHKLMTEWAESQGYPTYKTIPAKSASQPPDTQLGYYKYPAPDPDILSKYHTLQNDNPINATHPQQKSIDTYKGSGYHEINTLLRTGDIKFLGADKTSTQAHITNLMNAMKPLNSDVTVWRGVPIPPQAVGSILHDKAFTSTSLDHDVAYSWIKDTHKTNTPTVLRIDLPKGTPAMVVGGSEKEVLIPPGIKVKVISSHIVHESGGKTIVLMNGKVIQ